MPVPFSVSQALAEARGGMVPVPGRSAGAGDEPPGRAGVEGPHREPEGVGRQPHGSRGEGAISDVKRPGDLPEESRGRVRVPGQCLPWHRRQALPAASSGGR